MNKKWHVVITDNETGEVMEDAQSNAIIGAVEKDESVACIGFTNCNGKDLLKTLIAAKKAIKDISDKIPKEIMLLAELFEKFESLPDFESDTESAKA